MTYKINKNPKEWLPKIVSMIERFDPLLDDFKDEVENGDTAAGNNSRSKQGGGGGMSVDD